MTLLDVAVRPNILLSLYTATSFGAFYEYWGDKDLPDFYSTLLISGLGPRSLVRTQPSHMLPEAFSCRISYFNAEIILSHIDPMVLPRKLDLDPN